MMTILVSVKSIAPILMNRFVEEKAPEEKTQLRRKKDYGTPREQAELGTYKDADGRIWIPSQFFKSAMMNVSSDYKLVGTRKSVKSVFGGAVIMSEEKLYFKEN